MWPTGYGPPAQQQAVVVGQPSEAMGVPSGPEASDQQESLVTTVKDLQRSDHVAKEQWGAYCDTQGGGVRDPAKHNASFIQTFLSQYNAGVRFESATNANLAELFKEGQRKSANWKSAWAQYCQHYGGGMHDPGKHEVSFLVGFLDFLGQRGHMALTMLPQSPMLGMPGVVGAAPSKRPRPGMGQGGGLTGVYAPGGLGSGPSIGAAPSTGDPMKDQLITRVKTYQRSGDEGKQQWWSYCDAQLGGVRDPARHDSAVLNQFITTHGVA